MPRYIYFCENCEKDFSLFHGINEVQETCTVCESEQIKKMVTKPLRLKKQVKKSTGKLTKKYIEDNREILKNLKKENEKSHD